MLKEVLYTGIGIGAFVKEKVEKEVKALEERGKLESEEAKKFIQSLQERGEEEDKKMRENLKSILKEVISELDLATKADIEALLKEKS